MIVSGWLAPEYGWRACFQILRFVGLAVAPLLFLLPEPPRAADSGAAPHLGDIIRVLHSALRDNPAVVLTFAGATLLNYSVSSTIHVLTWMTQERGVPY